MLAVLQRNIQLAIHIETPENISHKMRKSKMKTNWYLQSLKIRKVWQTDRHTDRQDSCIKSPCRRREKKDPAFTINKKRNVKGRITYHRKAKYYKDTLQLGGGDVPKNILCKNWSLSATKEIKSDLKPMWLSRLLRCLSVAWTAIPK